MEIKFSDHFIVSCPEKNYITSHNIYMAIPPVTLVIVNEN